MLGGRPAGPVGVGAVAHQGQHAVGRQLAQPRQVRLAAAGGGFVELIVASMNDRADWRIDNQTNRAGDRVSHREQADLETAQLNCIGILHYVQLSLLKDIGFLQLALDHPNG